MKEVEVGSTGEEKVEQGGERWEGEYWINSEGHFERHWKQCRLESSMQETWNTAVIIPCVVLARPTTADIDALIPRCRTFGASFGHPLFSQNSEHKTYGKFCVCGC